MNTKGTFSYWATPTSSRLTAVDVADLAGDPETAAWLTEARRALARRQIDGQVRQAVLQGTQWSDGRNLIDYRLSVVTEPGGPGAIRCTIERSDGLAISEFIVSSNGSSALSEEVPTCRVERLVGLNLAHDAERWLTMVEQAVAACWLFPELAESA